MPSFVYPQPLVIALCPALSTPLGDCPLVSSCKNVPDTFNSPIAISHDRRRILHFTVSPKPHSQWAIQQLRETFSFDETARYVIRDNDAIFSEEFKQHIKRLGLEDTPTAPHSPWQNPFCERVNGTLRRECLDHLIILNEKHLRTVLADYIDNYYNIARTHMSLNKDSPVPRPVQPHGKIVSNPILGGLHHVYTRVA